MISAKPFSSSLPLTSHLEIRISICIQVLQNARSELLAKVRQQLESAGKEGTDGDVMRYVTLFGPLGAKATRRNLPVQQTMFVAVWPAWKAMFS